MSNAGAGGAGREEREWAGPLPWGWGGVPQERRGPVTQMHMSLKRGVTFRVRSPRSAPAVGIRLRNGVNQVCLPQHT